MGYIVPKHICISGLVPWIDRDGPSRGCFVLFYHILDRECLRGKGEKKETDRPWAMELAR